MGHVTGVLTGANGDPQYGRVVSAEPVEYDGSRSYAWTDEAGGYRLAAFPGDYHVSFQPYAETQQQQYIPGTPFVNGAATFTVVVGQDTVADDAAVAAGSISGRMTTADGQLSANVSVSFGDRETYGVGFDVVTYANGVFRAPMVIPGQYVVRFDGNDLTQF